MFLFCRRAFKSQGCQHAESTFKYKMYDNGRVD